ALQHQQQRLGDPAYIEQLARNKLHMCLRGETCYIVVGGQTAQSGAASTAALTPWYERLWQSGREATRGGARGGLARGWSRCGWAGRREGCGASPTAARAGCPTWWKPRRAWPTAPRFPPSTT